VYNYTLEEAFGHHGLLVVRNSKKICGIINKYYSTDNYTVGDGSMGKTYVHESEQPLLLSNFRVRLLNPDSSVVDSEKVQDDNTVFLSIISS